MIPFKCRFVPPHTIQHFVWLSIMFNVFPFVCNLFRIQNSCVTFFILIFQGEKGERGERVSVLPCTSSPTLVVKGLIGVILSATTRGQLRPLLRAAGGGINSLTPPTLVNVWDFLRPNESYVNCRLLISVKLAKQQNKKIF